MDIPQAVRAQRPSWINQRTVLGMVLFVVALVGGNRVLEASAQTHLVWSATRPLPAGVPLQPGDVSAVPVNLPQETLSGYLSADTSVEGQVLARPVAAGQLIAFDALPNEAPTSSARSITIPVDSQHALGGALRPGDVVDIYATFEAGTRASETRLLLEEAEVLDVVSAGTLIEGSPATVGLSVALDPAEAAAVVSAIRNAAIDVVRVGTGR